jgi:hypothetical protein
LNHYDNLDWNKISVVSQPMMDSFSYAPIYQHGANLFWRDSQNKLHRFPHMQSFLVHGYNTRDLIPVNNLEKSSFALGEEFK